MNSLSATGSMPTRKPAADRHAWLNWLQFATVLVAAPFFAFPAPRYLWVYVGVGALLALRFFVAGPRFEPTPISLSVGVLICQLCATCFVVPDIGFSLPKIAGGAYGVLTFYALQKVLTSARLLKSALGVFLAAGVSLALFGIIGMSWTFKESVLPGFLVELSHHIPRINWMLPGAEAGFNPNPLGGILLLVVPLAATVSVQYRRNAAFCVMAAIAFVVPCAVILFAQSIGVWLGLAVSLLLTGILSKRKTVRAVCIAVAVAMLGMYASSGYVGTVDSAALETKAKARLTFWSAGITAVEAAPFFGVGMNRLRVDSVFAQSIGRASAYQYSHAHNQLIHTAAELGIPALVGYLAMLIGAGGMCSQICRRSPEPWARMAALGLGAGQVGFFAFGLGDAVPIGAKPGIVFWWSLALITALHRFTRQASDLPLDRAAESRSVQHGPACNRSRFNWVTAHLTRTGFVGGSRSSENGPYGTTNEVLTGGARACRLDGSGA